MSQMRMLFVQVAILLSSCTVYGIAQTTSSCSCKSTIGKIPATIDTAPIEDTSSSLSGLFLNINDNSTCNGTVTAWDFCYYVINTPQQDQESTNIQAGVWRKQDGGYQLLNRSVIDLPIPSPERGFQFVCRHWSLNPTNETFTVQEGDTVGMYVTDTSMVHNIILGIPATDEQHNEIMKAGNITDIESPISFKQLKNTFYSLYLMAVIGCAESPTTSPNSNTDPTAELPTAQSTTKPPPSEPTTESPSEIDGTLWQFLIIAGLVVFIFLLFIIIIATICKLYSLHKRSKGSVPVLITKMKSGNQRVARIMTIVEEAPQQDNSTESEAGNGGSSQHRSQHPAAKSQPPPPPLISTDVSQSPPDQGEVTSLSGNRSPPPVVAAVSFDIEQEHGDDQDKVTLKPNLHKSSHIKAEKVALLPKSDLKRSHSAVDAVNILYNTVDINSPFTVSTEYPYVLHAFEVVGKNQTHVGSLPNILEYRSIDDKTTLNPCGNEKDNQDGTAYAQIDTDDSNSDADDEPSYSYADRRHIHLVCTAAKNPQIKTNKPTVKQAKNNNYHYGEHPSAWNPASQLVFQSTKQNGEHTMVAHNQPESSTQTSNHVLPQDLKQANDMQNNALPPKPAIQPRTKPAYKVTSNMYSTNAHPPMGAHTDEESQQPPQRRSSNLTVANQGTIDEPGDSAMLAAQTPPIYMKLLKTTKEDSHKYTYLLNGEAELSELNISDIDAERAHPNEWCKQTKC